jgi:hypothetical protein
MATIITSSGTTVRTVHTSPFNGAAIKTLFPKHRQKFRVSFYLNDPTLFSPSENATIIEHIKVLEQAVVRLELPVMSFVPTTVAMSVGATVNWASRITAEPHSPIGVIFMDDLRSEVIRSLNVFAVSQMRSPFSIMVELLDVNDSVVETLIASVMFNAFSRSELDYAPLTKQVTGTITDIGPSQAPQNGRTVNLNMPNTQEFDHNVIVGQFEIDGLVSMIYP